MAETIQALDATAGDIPILEDAIAKLQRESGLDREHFCIVSHQDSPYAGYLEYNGLPWYHDTDCSPDNLYVMRRRFYDRTWKS
jgi:hypothetical protein